MKTATSSVQAIIYIDGASKGNPGPAGAGIVITAPTGDVLREISVPIPYGTNNFAEYTGLIEGLRAARTLDLSRVEIRTDSELMARQLNGEYRVKSPQLRPLHTRALRLLRDFEVCRVIHVAREKNAEADKLAAAAAQLAVKLGSRQSTQGSLD
ncbi:MAG: ribonuclease HI family protein, partial [Candidatus Zipacnadales bacterium]